MGKPRRAALAPPKGLQPGDCFLKGDRFVARHGGAGTRGQAPRDSKPGNRIQSRTLCPSAPRAGLARAHPGCPAAVASWQAGERQPGPPQARRAPAQPPHGVLHALMNMKRCECAGRRDPMSSGMRATCMSICRPERDRDIGIFFMILLVHKTVHTWLITRRQLMGVYVHDEWVKLHGSA